MTPAPAPRAWTPGPLIRASIWLHLGAGAVSLVRPELATAALAAIAANHAGLTAAGLWPRSTGLGPNLVQLGAASVARREIALTFDDGPDPEITPRVLDRLDAVGARATFFCIAERAARHPALCAEIVARGHSVQNHSARHGYGFALLGPRGFAREIGAAQDTLASITGVTPTFFRAPAGLRNPLLDPVLARLGLQLASWTRRGFDTRRRDPARIVAALDAAISPGGIVLMHDGSSARMSDGGAVVLPVLDRVLALCEARRLRPLTLPEALR
ncbi:MAG TPA: polysaccharide deacetylase family protein [Burkholderiaceae bacterium]|nr:polysaccharide deacetylase family protein [Burkholderiaceae bacterium]